MPKNAGSFAAEFFRDYRALDPDASRAERLRSERRAMVSPSEQLRTLIDDDHEEAWRLILVLLERAPDERAFAFVAAGPVEDFVHAQGIAYSARIIEEAATNRRIRKALDMTWIWATVPEPVRTALMPLLSADVRSHWDEQIAKTTR